MLKIIMKYSLWPLTGDAIITRKLSVYNEPPFLLNDQIN